MTSIFVAKLDFATTEDELKSLFEQYGKVNRVTIAKDRETGKPRGFAFVEMPDEASADAAIDALDESEVNGRTIAVKKADDRGSKPPGARPASNDRPIRTDSRPPRPDDRRSDSPGIAIVTPPEYAKPSLLGGDRKKEKEKEGFGKKSDRPKQNKMEAYKKSGKDNQFLNDEDFDDDLDLFGRNEDEDEEEDYRKYLVNSDDDSEEDDYEDDEEWDDEDEEEGQLLTQGVSINTIDLIKFEEI